MGKIAPDLTGNRFGKVVVLGRSEPLRGRAAWLCRCDCGAERALRADRLQDGRASSCGSEHCRYAPADEIHRKTYQSWWAMVDRCSNPENDGWVNYGGRGIEVCRRWRVFESFLIDMGRKPSPEHTIERNDVNGNYEPSNCRWATKAEQRRNLRSSFFVEHEGRRVLLMDLCAERGLSREVVYGRLKLGWSLDDALLVPVRPKSGRAAA